MILVVFLLYSLEIHHDHGFGRPSGGSGIPT